MPIVHSLPYHFVDYLTDPGLRTVAGRVPLKQYLSLSKGNAEIDALMAQMRAHKITDTDTNKTADQTVGSTEMNLIWKGQGHPDAFVKFMNFLWDNQEQLEGVRGTLGQVYEKYFKTNTGQNPLGRMIKDHYFGIDCIGFVANYLRYVGLWDKYYGYEIDQWDRVFTKNVKSAADVQGLNLMVWPASHVALVDWVHEYVGSNQVRIDMCQSSAGGPQCNEYVLLTDTGQTFEKGYKKFSIAEGRPDPPVKGHCYIMRWPDLHYQQPPRPASQSGGRAASGTY